MKARKIILPRVQRTRLNKVAVRIDSEKFGKLKNTAVKAYVKALGYTHIIGSARNMSQDDREAELRKGISMMYESESRDHLN